MNREFDVRREPHTLAQLDHEYIVPVLTPEDALEMEALGYVYGDEGAVTKQVPEFGRARLPPSRLSRSFALPLSAQSGSQWIAKS
jgi:hypothetical protein